MKAKNEDKEDGLYDTRGCFSLFVHTESRAHEWEGRHVRDERGWVGDSRVHWGVSRLGR